MKTIAPIQTGRRNRLAHLCTWLLLVGAPFLGQTSALAQPYDVDLRLDFFRDYGPGILYPGTTLSYLSFDLHNASFTDVSSPIFVEILLSRNNTFGDADDVTLNQMTMDVVVPWGQTTNVVLNGTIYPSDAELLSDLRIPADACGYYTNMFMKVTFPSWADYTNSRAYPVSMDNVKGIGRTSHVFNQMGPAPTVKSINRLSPTAATNSASSVTWRVTFSDTVNILTRAGFVVTNLGGSISGYSVTSMQQPSANQADVTVSTGTGSGVLRLDVVYPPAAIQSLCEVTLTTGFAGQTYTIIDTNPPPVLTVTSVVVPSQTNGSISSVDAIFSAPITASTFTYQDISLTCNGISVTLDATVATSLVSANTYRISGLGFFTAAPGTYVITVDASGIKDASGNWGTGTGSGTWNNIQMTITFTQLTPSGAAGSRAEAVSGFLQAGYVTIGTTNHASAWSGTAASFVDLNPPIASESWAYGTSGTQQVGYAKIAGATHACLWSGTAGSSVDLHPAGEVASEALAVNGSQQVGWVSSGSYQHAALWSETSNSFVDLNPPGSVISEAHGTSGSRQVGWAAIGGHYHAAMWSSTALSFTDLNPAGALESWINATSGSQQVGWADVGIQRHAALWSNTAGSAVDLNPPGSTYSEAYATTGSYQAGGADVGSSYHASLWSGTANSFIDLHSCLGSGYATSTATGIWADTRAIYIVGYASSAAGRYDAILWTVTKPSLPVVYVDCTYIGTSPDGSLQAPFKTVTTGYQAAQTNDTITIFKGNYNEAILMTKPLLLQATNGVVNIGTP